MFSLGPSKLHSWSCLPQLSSLWTWYYVLFPEAYLRSSGSDSFLSSGSKTEVGIKEPLQRFWPKQRNPLNIALPSEPAQHLEGGGVVQPALAPGIQRQGCGWRRQEVTPRTTTALLSNVPSQPSSRSSLSSCCTDPSSIWASPRASGHGREKLGGRMTAS